MRDGTGVYTFSYDSENRYRYAGYPFGARATYAYDEVCQRKYLVDLDSGALTTCTNLPTGGPN